MRLAQDFAQRYPLVDGQGNFGNIDGDNAAAMRYTESRLTAVAEALLAGIDENAVDFRPTYDGEDNEPVVLPARFPNLLANGASRHRRRHGDQHPAAQHRRAVRRARPSRAQARAPRVAELVELLPGPDFPTGGVLVEDARGDRARPTTPAAAASACARAGSARSSSHGLYQVVVTEIPYQVQKSRLIERIAELLEEKKLPLLADVRDESTEQVRLVLEPKTRNVDPARADGIAVPRDRARRCACRSTSTCSTRTACRA